MAAFAFLYSIIASRLERTPVNGALVYLFAGLICGTAGMEILVLDIDAEGIRRLAEVTLALVLSADSSNANLGVLRQVKAIPTRLLLIGLPLTIVAGFAVGLLIFDQLTFIEIALLATMLAPTDAALQQAGHIGATDQPCINTQAVEATHWQTCPSDNREKNH